MQITKIFKWFWALRWWNKFFVGLLSVFAYFFVTGMYAALDSHSEQDVCSFNTVSNAEYREILASMTYRLSDLRHDYQSMEDMANVDNGFTAILEPKIRAELRKYLTFDRKVAATHAFMREMGYSHYNTRGYIYPSAEEIKTRYDFNMQYKMPSAKLGYLNIFNIITRGPSTVFVHFITDETYQNPEFTGFRAKPVYVFLLNSIPTNYDQIFKCPDNRLNNTNYD